MDLRPEKGELVGRSKVWRRRLVSTRAELQNPELCLHRLRGLGSSEFRLRAGRNEADSDFNFSQLGQKNIRKFYFSCLDI